MTRLLRRAPVTWVLCFSAGCAPPVMAASAFLDKTLATKAAFDLKCPRADVHFTDLGGPAVGGPASYNGTPVVTVDDVDYTLASKLGRQQGASGCGRQASYTYERGAWVGSGAASDASDAKDAKDAK